MSQPKPHLRRPVLGANLPEKKEVRSTFDPDTYSKMPISWRVGKMDRGHDEWGWHLPNDNDRERTVWDRIHSALKNYETMTWSEIDSKKSCHSWDPFKLPSKAQQALKALGYKLDLLENLYQLRVGGEGRLFGLRDRAVFSLIWWDSGHSVKPVEKRGT